MIYLEAYLSQLRLCTPLSVRVARGRGRLEVDGTNLQRSASHRQFTDKPVRDDAPVEKKFV